MEKIIKSRPTFLFFLSSFCNRNYTMIKLLSSLQVSGNRVHFLNIKHTLVAISSYFLQFSSGKTKMVGRLRHAPAGEGQMQSSGNILLGFFFFSFFFFSMHDHVIKLSLKYTLTLPWGRAVINRGMCSGTIWLCRVALWQVSCSIMSHVTHLCMLLLVSFEYY